MAKFGGFGGGNMQQLMRQAQKMQQEMMEAQEELKTIEVTGASGGLVEVTMTCEKQVVGIKIKPEAVDPDDIEMLEDLIIASFNDAVAKAEEQREQKLGKFAGLGF